MRAEVAASRGGSGDLLGGGMREFSWVMTVFYNFVEIWVNTDVCIFLKLNKCVLKLWECYCIIILQQKV